MRFKVDLWMFISFAILFSVTAGAQVAVNLVYDADENLVAKTVNGVTTRYLIDDMNPTGLSQVMEETVNGVVQRRYTYGKQRISETQLINGSWITSNYVYDAEGNVRQLTDASGIVTDTYEYDAFGNLVNHTGTTPNVYLYRGERYDPDMGLYYMRARWYNPATGRFMSRDPEEGETTDPASLHKYLYAGGDPVNLADPSGRNAMPVYIPPPGPELVPPSTPKPAWGAMEYTLVLGVAALGSVAASKKEACAINTAFSTLGLSMGSVPSGGGMAIPEPEKCKAKCPPCDPPAGTQCFEPHSGHPILKISVGIRIITCGGGIRILIHAVAIGTI